MKLTLETRREINDKKGLEEGLSEFSCLTEESQTDARSAKVIMNANSISFLSPSRRAYARFFAYVAIFGCWLFIGIKGWAGYREYAKQNESVEQKPVSKIAALQSGYPRITILGNGAQKVVDIAPQAAVTLNNVPASLKALRKADAVSVGLNGEKAINKITERQTAGGYVLSFDPNSMTTTSNYSDRKSTAITPDTKIVCANSNLFSCCRAFFAHVFSRLRGPSTGGF